MAIENVVADFNNGTPAAIAGKTVNSIGSSSVGVLSSDLLGYDTGTTTGISLSTSHSLTASSGGRSVSSPTSELATEMNAQGCYAGDLGAGGLWDLTFTVPATVTDATVIVPLCTTFSGQTNFTVTVNGTAQTGINATANTSGTFSTFSGVVPDGSNQIVISIEDLDSSNNYFIFSNGLRLEDIVEAAATTTGTINQTLENATTSASGSVSSPSISGSLASSLENVSASASGIVSALPISGSLASNLESVSISASGFVEVLVLPFVNDTFDGSGALGAHWLNYNSIAVTDVARASGYLSGLVDDNAGNKTLWLSANRGRLDYQPVTIPVSGSNIYEALGCGVGPANDPLSNMPHIDSSTMLSGVAVHDENLLVGNWEFLVVGNRNDNITTVESKSTRNDGTSVVGHHGDNAVGVGATHADFQVEVLSTGFVKFNYRAIGDTTWLPIHGDGDTLDPINYGSSGDTLLLGLIGYAYFSADELPFRYTVDSIELLAPPTGTINQTLENATTSAVGTLTASGTISEALESVTSSSIGSAIVTSELSQSLDSATIAASGIVGNVIAGAISETLENVNITAAGLVPYIGDISETLGDVIGAAFGIIALDINGQISQTLEGVSILADGFILIDYIEPKHNMSIANENRIMRVI